ncbi:MAG: hypothetical protein K0Q95_3241 [Bacteroidota bacterium]|jgi:hypothetical protein|nr:hypothetical protein [Bacteroidota bacterium]
MKNLLTILMLTFTITAFSQKEKPLYSFGGKMGNCTMTWDEFMSCKKELTAIDKTVSVNSYILTIQKAEKKDTVQIEYPSRGNAFSKQAIESIEKLHKDKKMGNKVVIDAVQIVQSGKEARKVNGMIITLN